MSVSELLATDRTPTRIEWSFVEDDGQLFRRFSRKTGVEIWLWGVERPLPPWRDRMAGKFILEPSGEHRQTRQVVWGVEIDPLDGEQATEIAEQIRPHFPAFPPMELFEKLLLLGKSPPEAATILTERLAQETIDLIADAVAERIAA